MYRKSGEQPRVPVTRWLAASMLNPGLWKLLAIVPSIQTAIQNANEQDFPGVPKAKVPVGRNGPLARIPLPDKNPRRQLKKSDFAN